MQYQIVYTILPLTMVMNPPTYHHHEQTTKGSKSKKTHRPAGQLNTGPKSKKEDYHKASITGLHLRTLAVSDRLKLCDR